MKKLAKRRAEGYVHPSVRHFEITSEGGFAQSEETGNIDDLDSSDYGTF